jgi:hypothetical protein
MSITDKKRVPEAELDRLEKLYRCEGYGTDDFLFADICAELLSMRRSQWRPIESAPIGTHILVRAKLFGEWGVFSVIKYQGVNIHGHPFKGFSVTGCGCQEGGTDFDEPTHWMPPPPKDSV